MVVPRFVNQALSGQTLRVYGDGHQTRTFCDVRDVVRALIGLVESKDTAGEVFNIGSSLEITIAELARRVLKLAKISGFKQRTPYGVSEEIVHVPYDSVYGEGFEDMIRRLPDISKIRRAIGWEPTIHLDDTLLGIIEGRVGDSR